MSWHPNCYILFGSLDYIVYNEKNIIIIIIIIIIIRIIVYQFTM